METTDATMVAVDRARSLDDAVARLVADRHGRVGFHSGERAVIFTGRPVNHLLHLVITVLTAGAWVLPWLIITITNHEDAHTLTVDDAGVVSETVSGRTRVAGRLRWVRVLASIVVLASLGCFLVVSSAVPRLALLSVAGAGLVVLAADIHRRGTGRIEPKVRVLPRD